MISFKIISLIISTLILNYASASQYSKDDKQFQDTFNPLGPLVRCSFLPSDFIDCDHVFDHKGNVSAKNEAGYGCLKLGGVNYQDVERTRVLCTVLPDIECHGNKTFWRNGFPCIKYTDHYFVTTLIYSILLGFLGMDRFCLGQVRDFSTFLG